MVCPVDKLLVTIEKKFQDEVTAPEGMKFYQDTSFMPEQHVTTVGIVVSVPRKFSNKTEFIGLVPEVQVGDEVCFNYQVVFDVDENGRHQNLIWHNEQELWRVDYSQVFCVRRNGELIMIGGNVLVDEYEAEVVEKFKNSILYVPDSMKQKNEKGKGVLRHIGTPRSNDPELDVEVGDVVVFRPEIAAVYEIFGKQQIVIRQRDLLATLKKVV